MEKEPRLEISTEKVIVVDNIPKVGIDKKEKLKTILTKLLVNYGKIINESYPENEAGVLQGYMFVEYESEISAQDAVSQLNNYRLDKSHTFKVNMFSDFEKYKELNLSSSEADTPVPYKNPGNLMWWLLKNDSYDQYCLLYSDIFTTVYANTPGQPTALKSREVSPTFHVELTLIHSKYFVVFLKEMDRDKIPVVAKRHIPCHIPRSWYCFVGR